MRPPTHRHRSQRHPWGVSADTVRSPPASARGRLSLSAMAEQGARVHGLPVPPSSLIGREDEADRLIELLARSRLVTMTGPGGVGKTRLALEVARRMGSSFTNGAAFVGLADLDD